MFPSNRNSPHVVSRFLGNCRAIRALISERPPNPSNLCFWGYRKGCDANSLKTQSLFSSKRSREMIRRDQKISIRILDWRVPVHSTHSRFSRNQGNRRLLGDGEKVRWSWTRDGEVHTSCDESFLDTNGPSSLLLASKTTLPSSTRRFHRGSSPSACLTVRNSRS